MTTTRQCDRCGSNITHFKHYTVVVTEWKFQGEGEWGDKETHNVDFCPDCGAMFIEKLIEKDETKT